MALPKDHVPKMERTCSIHGKTTHSQKISGATSIYWQCMKCDSDRVNKYNQEIRSGVKVKGDKKFNTKTLPKTKYCQKHFIQLNALGECGDCE